jgi:excisionase family DNA binding protein
MPRTTTKPQKKTKAGAKPLNGRPPEALAGDVLTLTEAAAYLRLTESEMTLLVQTQGLPGRAVGAEWRFLKTALQDWLRASPSTKPSKEALLARAGSWKDDPDLDEMLKEIHKRRGRPMTEDGE